MLDVLLFTQARALVRLPLFPSRSDAMLVAVDLQSTEAVSHAPSSRSDVCRAMLSTMANAATRRMLWELGPWTEGPRLPAFDRYAITNGSPCLSIDRLVLNWVRYRGKNDYAPGVWFDRDLLP